MCFRPTVDLSKPLSFVDHVIDARGDVFIGGSRYRSLFPIYPFSDRNRCTPLGLVVFSRHFEHTVVEFEGDRNLRDAARTRGDAGQLDLPNEMVVLRHGALPFVNLDKGGRLVVLGCAECLRAPCRICSAAVDELRHDATDGLHP
mmetsp:Transcript_36988/g.50036  ORF Transcript_36988/g.50036 Transcript_36988/m.50036 type:complete len:145 (+) Transcript_36988:517-951(+)